MKSLHSFDDAIMDAMAKVFARDVEMALSMLRKNGFPDVPADYDFGISSSFDGRGVVFKMRLTSGAVTVREIAEVSTDIVCDFGKRDTFNDRITGIIARLAANFAMRWLPKKD